MLLIAAVVFFIVYRLLDGSEHHSFNSGARPPATVHVTEGQQYEISTPGGLTALAHQGLDAAAISCTYSQGGGPAVNLATSTLAGSRTTHAVATFIAPVTGDIRVSCPGLRLGAFVDNSDDGAADLSGLFLLLSTIAAALAVPLGMSYLYRRSTERAQPNASIDTDSRSRQVANQDS